MLTKAIESQIKNNSDVTFIKNMPYGTAKEIMNFKTIKKVVSAQEENTLQIVADVYSLVVEAGVFKASSIMVFRLGRSLFSMMSKPKKSNL